MSLHDKVVIVTGSTKGIGFAISKEFAENKGATVVVCSRSKHRANYAANLIRGKTFPAKLDVTDLGSIKTFLQQILSSHKRVDILINNAGYPFDREIWYKRFHEVTDDDVQKIMEVDLKGSIRLSREVIANMIKNDTGGVIINISSTPALSGHTEGAPYTIAKAAIIALTKQIAMEYGIRHIRAYTLTLGNIATEATYDSMTQKDRKKAAEEPSMKRWGMPEEVAKVASCIASDNFSFATGNTIVVDGGTVLI